MRFYSNFFVLYVHKGSFSCYPLAGREPLFFFSPYLEAKPPENVIQGNFITKKQIKYGKISETSQRILVLDAILSEESHYPCQNVYRHPVQKGVLAWCRLPTLDGADTQVCSPPLSIDTGNKELRKPWTHLTMSSGSHAGEEPSVHTPSTKQCLTDHRTS